MRLYMHVCVCVCMCVRVCICSYFICSFVDLCNETSFMCSPQSMNTGIENPRNKKAITKKSGKPLNNLLTTSNDVTSLSLLLVYTELSSL